MVFPKLFSQAGLQVVSRRTARDRPGKKRSSGNKRVPPEFRTGLVCESLSLILGTRRKAWEVCDTAREKGSEMLGVLFFVLSVPVLGAWVFQVFFSEGEYRIADGADYLSLPSEFWSTVLFALFLALQLEGIRRWSGRT